MGYNNSMSQRKKTSMGNTVRTLHSARRARNDEFYTQRSDIEAELEHYEKHFDGKTVYCNCDDPRESGFFYYFSHQFEHFGLKRLITTCYKSDSISIFSKHDKDRAIALEYTGKQDANGGVPKVEDIGIRALKGNGDFRSEECIKLLKQADIVVTNPPFSLFREYVAQLIQYNKKFLIIGNLNAVSYREIFPFIRDNKVWLGNGFRGGNAYFRIPPDAATDFAQGVYDKKTGLVRFRNVTWFTNLDHEKRHEELRLVRWYNSKDYPKYDNYDAINVGQVVNIPRDYPGEMGVPISFLNKFNPKQFEILGQMANTRIDENNYGYPFVNGQKIYARLIIKNKHPERRQ